MSTRTQGLVSEDIAKRYLESKGYRYVESNFYANRRGEVDLVMRDKDYLVFVEVKSLAANSSYTIYESLTRRKKWRIKFAIDRWLSYRNKVSEIWRFDFVGIILNSDNSTNKIEHFSFVELV